MTKLNFKEKLLIVLIIIGLMANCLTKANGQTVVKDSAGVFVTAKTSASKEADKTTGKMFKCADGQLLPVYVSKNQKYYVLRVSKKTNKIYKQYLTL